MNNLIKLTAYDTTEWGARTFFFDKSEIRFIYQQAKATPTTTGKRCLCGVHFREPIEINCCEIEFLIVKEDYTKIIELMDNSDDR